jgi:hypothetical protein
MRRSPKRKTSMFAEATCMTRVVLDLITRERKTPKYMTKGGGVGMTQASMPEIHTGGEGNRGGGGGGGGGVDRVELVGAVTSVEYHPGTSVLNRKTTLVKLNGNRIFTCKRTNRDKIFNKIRRN